MKYFKIAIAVFGIVLMSGCKTNPFTGKKILNGFGNDKLFPMAYQQYNTFLSENKVIKGTDDAKMIVRVGERIKMAATKWLNANGHQGYLADYKWEYNLVDDKTVNAWCMPGGKIVFYTGILPVAANETAIAAIMGHEVAHALADHGGQRMTAGAIQKGVGMGVQIATSGQSQQAQQGWMQAYGMVSNVGGMLPFSRSHETEADKIGLVLMAIAGYNPDEASKLWERMKAKSGGKSQAEILSTHPSNDKRISVLKELAPFAKSEAKKFGITKFRPLGRKLN